MRCDGALLLCLLIAAAGCTEARRDRHHRGHRFFNDVEDEDDHPPPGARHEHHERTQIRKGQFSVKHLCKGDLDQLCGGHKASDRAEKDALFSCLESKRDEIKDAKCRAVITKRMACKDDVKKFCPQRVKADGGRGKGAGHDGRGMYDIQCLSGHAGQLSEGCKAAQPCLGDMAKHCSKFKRNVRWQWKCLAGVRSKNLTPKCKQEVASWKAQKASFDRGPEQAMARGVNGSDALPHRKRLALSGDTKALLVGMLAGVLSTLCVLLMYRQCSAMRGERGPPKGGFNKVSNEEQESVVISPPSSAAVVFPIARPVAAPASVATPTVPPPSYSSLCDERVPSACVAKAEQVDPPSFNRGATLSSHPSFSKASTFK